jgi:hypothetical protein
MTSDEQFDMFLAHAEWLYQEGEKAKKEFLQKPSPALRKKIFHIMGRMEQWKREFPKFVGEENS